MGWKRIHVEDILGDKFVCPHCHMSQRYGDTPFCPNCGKKVREMTAEENFLMEWIREEYEDGHEWA